MSDIILNYCFAKLLKIHQIAISDACQIAGILRKLFPSFYRSGSGGHSKTVASLVLRMSGVPFQPMERDRVLAVNLQKPHPEINVFDFFPIPPLPRGQPAFVDCFNDVRRIAEHFHLGVFPFDGFQSSYHSEQFHSVVGGLGKASAELFFHTGALQNDSVASGTRVPAGRPVSEKEYFRPFLFFHIREYRQNFLGGFKNVANFGNMNVLVTGANGQLGTELRNVTADSRDHYIFSDVTSLPGVETINLDITNEDAVKIICDSEDVDVIVNCAAYTNVDKAEDDPATAMLLNSAAAGILARVAAQRGAALIHISTDYVFHGDRTIPCKEDWPTDPLGVYGSTKLSGEKEIEKSGCRCVMFRTAWLYSPYGKNFVKTMRQLTSERDSLKVVFDQIGTPTYALDLARLIAGIIDGNLLDKTGIYHFSDEGAVSWYDFAQAVKELSGNTCDIQPCHTEDFPSKAQRPRFSVLDKTKVKETFGVVVPYWRDSLKDCIERMK